MSLFLTVYENDHTVNGEYIYGTDMSLVTEGFIDTVISKLREIYKKILKACRKIKEKIVELLKVVYNKLSTMVSKFRGTVSGQVELFEHYIPALEDNLIMHPLRDITVPGPDEVGMVDKYLDTFFRYIQVEDMNGAKGVLSEAKQSYNDERRHVDAAIASKKTQIVYYDNKDQLLDIINEQGTKMKAVKEAIDQLEERIESDEIYKKFILPLNSVNDLDDDNPIKQEKVEMIKEANKIHIDHLNNRLRFAQFKLDQYTKNAKLLLTVRDRI